MTPWYNPDLAPTDSNGVCLKADKLINHSLSDDANEDKIASVEVNNTIVVAIAKDANITEDNASPVITKVVGVDRNIVTSQHFIEFERSKFIEDKLEEKQRQTDVAELIKKAPENDVANQFRELLKSINIDKFKSRKVGVIKLTSRVSLQNVISLVVYTTGCITSYSVNMVH